MAGHSELMEQRKMALEIKEAQEDIGEEKFTEFFKNLEEIDISTTMPLKERLEKMRADMGDDMFDRVAKGDSLMDTLDRWVYERIETHIEKMVDETSKFFVENGHEEITKKHVYMLFGAMTTLIDE